jgi:eukaryotic-like serine/threonine-protein kinase
MRPVQDVLAGRYQLLDVLGRGGMGVVYRATDQLLDRTVAVKVLPVDRAADPAFVIRFEREALAAAALSHPNIVAVFDSGHDGETHYIVMECIDGQSLAQLLHRDGRLGTKESVGIATQIASALGAAHRSGIVHRDVKPANAMIDRQGLVKVLDFGIARAAASVPITQTAVVLGSAPYIAPEVTQGNPADARSDIYSLGCVLYELLTGRPPFTGELPAAILHQQNTAIPRSPKELNPAVPGGLDALVLQMLAKDPDQRPQDAGELASALPGSLEDTAATTVLSSARARRWRLGRTERVGLGAALLLVIAGLAIAVLGSSSPSHKAAPAHPRTGATSPVVTQPASRLGTVSAAATAPPPSPAPAPRAAPDHGPKHPGRGPGKPHDH